MASPAVVYFAGIGTVVTALALGFGSALMLVSTQPVQKEQPAAFAKREVIAVEQAPVVAAPAAQRAEPADPLAGLAPPVTALPIPKADDVSKALMQSPPPAVTAPASAPGQTTATRPTPVLPPAPPTFSMTMVCPRDTCMCSERMRPIASVEPPAGNGTTMVMVREG